MKNIKNLVNYNLLIVLEHKLKNPHILDFIY
jgi:hypothetical protein